MRLGRGAELGEKRVGGFVFRRYVGDHPPDHIHVFRNGQETRRLARALKEAGYLREGEK